MKQWKHDKDLAECKIKLSWELIIYHFLDRPQVSLNEILTSAKKFVKRLLKLLNLIALRHIFNQVPVAISKIIIMWTALCISYELQNMYTIRRAIWFVAGREWKIDSVKVKIITFVIKPSGKFTTTVHHKYEIKVACQVLWFISFLNS